MKKFSLFVVLFCLASIKLQAAESFISFVNGDWQLNEGGRVAVYVSSGDERGVMRAAENLKNDLRAVCGANVTFTDTPDQARIVVGTVGKVATVKSYEAQLRGKHEQFIIDARQGQLVIAGSDRRGTIYGIYEVSRQAGVSPWYYWADSPIAHHDKLYVANGSYTDGEPAVRWRGLFLNDEAPASLVG